MKKDSSTTSAGAGSAAPQPPASAAGAHLYAAISAADYYARITSQDIGAVARDLGVKIAGETSRELSGDCMNHASTSGKSLTIWIGGPKAGRFYCFGCGVGGDVLQLVEFVRYGKGITKGISGAMPEQHRAARDWLGERAGLPPLSTVAMSPEDHARAEAARNESRRVQAVLTATAALYHERLLANVDGMLDWFSARWPIGAAGVADFEIGYADNSPWKDPRGNARPDVVSALLRGDAHAPESIRSTLGHFTARELVLSGAFRPTGKLSQDTGEEEEPTPFFDRRIVFPYWSRGSVVFFIGRRTTHTPEYAYELGKYRKLPVPDSGAHSAISKTISNSHLYNEDALLSAPKAVIITEGVTDCIVLSEQLEARGVITISPVTVNLAAADVPRILPKLKAVETVYLCQDNEISQAGMTGALRTAEKLQAAGIATRIIELPLDAAQVTARETLAARYNFTVGAQPGELAARVKAAGDEASVGQALLEAAKQDVASYFLAHAADEFLVLMAAALSPLELAVSRLPAFDCEHPEALAHALDPLMALAARLSPLEQEALKKRLCARFGKAISPSTIGAMLAEAKRRIASEAKLATARVTGLATGAAEPGSCKEAVSQALAGASATDLDAYKATGTVVFHWLSNNGARWCRTARGETFLFFGQRIYWLISSGASAATAEWRAFLFKLTGIETTVGAAGKTLAAVIMHQAVELGERRELFTWIHSKVEKRIVYLALNNAKNEIARIAPGGITIMANGANIDDVITRASEKFLGFDYVDGVTGEELDRLLNEHVANHFSCSALDRKIILLWLSSFFLIEFSSTRPLLRFEGPASSGKSTAAKFISTLIFGRPALRKSTVAANYADAAGEPLLVLDNVETDGFTVDLRDLLLLGASGAERVKRAAGTDSQTFVEIIKCFILTTGIEALGGGLAELMSRSFVINFCRPADRTDDFLETEALAGLQANRSRILSGLIDRTSRVLALIESGARTRAMSLIAKTLPNHAKSRTNEWLSLMYLSLIVDQDEAQRDAYLATLSPAFRAAIEEMNTTTDDIAQESNPIAQAMSGLFDKWRVIYAMGDREAEQGFEQEYPGIAFDGRATTKTVTMSALFSALKKFSREHGVRFSYDNAHQFSRRMTNDLKLIESAGFRISRRMLFGRNVCVIHQNGILDEASQSSSFPADNMGGL